MPSMFSCSSCVVWLLSAVVLRGVGAQEYAIAANDTIHRIDKVQVSVIRELRYKRDATVCPINYSGCPQSQNGGCCPQNYECATNSCYATTAAPGTACGKVGYHACAVQYGGCCREGYVCGVNSCTPPAAVTVSPEICKSNYYACPSSMHYGCCPSGMGCGVNACYNTAVSTLTYTEVLTTTNSESDKVVFTTTHTSTSTPTPPGDIPTGDGSDAADVQPKYIPDTVAKMPATDPGSSKSSSGLTKGQIGGIVAGAVVVLAVVLMAAFFVIRHMKRVERAVERRTQASGSSSADGPTVEQLKDGSTVSTQPLHPRQRNDRPKRQQQHARSASDTDYDPSTIYPTPSPFQGGSSGYTSVPTATSTNGTRAASIDSASPSGGYFDAAAAAGGAPSFSAGRSRAGSADSAGRAAGHGRHASNASELSADSGNGGSGGGGLRDMVSPLIGSPLSPAELSQDTAALPELPGVQTTGGDAGGGRRRGRAGTGGGGGAGAGAVPGRPPMAHARSRGESAGAGGGLAAVREGAEGFMLHHGFYGDDRLTGQTGVGLGLGVQGGHTPRGPSPNR